MEENYCGCNGACCECEHKNYCSQSMTNNDSGSENPNNN